MDVTQGDFFFFKAELNRFEFNFLFPRLVVIPRLKSLDSLSFGMATNAGEGKLNSHLFKN